jgi:hypothetical protein
MRVFDVALRFVQDGDKAGLVVDLTLGAGPSSVYSWSAEETAIGAAPTLPQYPVPQPESNSWTANVVNVSAGGGLGTFTKTGGSNASYDASVYSTEGYYRAYAGFTALSTSYDVAVGLDTSPTGSNNRDTIDYAWFAGSGAAAYVFRSGSSSGPYTYTAGDRFEIVRDSTSVRWYQNGVLIESTAVAGAVSYLDSSFLDIGDAISKLTFGPISSVGTDQIDPHAGTETFSVFDAGPEQTGGSTADASLTIKLFAEQNSSRTYGSANSPDDSGFSSASSQTITEVFPLVAGHAVTVGIHHTQSSPSFTLDALTLSGITAPTDGEWEVVVTATFKAEISILSLPPDQYSLIFTDMTLQAVLVKR